MRSARGTDASRYPDRRRAGRSLPVALVSALAGPALWVCAATAAAQGFESDRFGESGLSLGIGEADLYPSLRVGYVRDDNAYLVSDGETETSGVVVEPTFRFVADRRLLELEASYSGEYADYDEDPLDYADHALALSAAAELSARRRTSGRLRYRRRHERLGTGETRGVAENFAEQVEFDTVEAEGRLRYGADGARGNVEVGADVRWLAYATLDELTDGDDFVRVAPYGLFSLRVSPDTRALLQLRYALVDFDEDFRDRSDYTALIGVELGRDGKSGGSAKVGATRAVYAAEGREEATILAFEAGLFYLPRTYSRLELEAIRELDDRADGASAGDGEAQVIRDRIDLRWRHEWSSRVLGDAVVSRSSNERDCPESSDATVSAAFRLSVRVRRWLEIGASVGTAARRGEDCSGVDGDGDALDYTDNTVGAHIRATL